MDGALTAHNVGCTLNFGSPTCHAATVDIRRLGFFVVVGVKIVGIVC